MKLFNSSRELLGFTAFSVSIVTFAVILTLPQILLTTGTGRSAKENLSRMPTLLHSAAQFLAPEAYVVPKKRDAGRLLSIDISHGPDGTMSFVETTQGFYSVAGVVSAIKNSHIFLTGLSQEILKNKLCIGESTAVCYTLTDSRSL